MSDRTSKVKGKLSHLDVEVDVDLMIAVANLIKLEEHLANSYEATHEEIYLRLWNETRMDRGFLLSKFLEMMVGDLSKINKSSDVWCTLKHSLSVWYGLREVASKLIAEGKMDCAKKIMEKAEKERARFVIYLELLKT